MAIKSLSSVDIKKHRFFPDFKKNYQLYLMSLPVLIFFLLFAYGPMYGIQIAFKDFSFSKGIMGSDWIGFDNFERFIKSYHFVSIMKNTITISFYSLIAGFPMPIIFALILNETRGKWLKKTTQMVTYAPHFISTVVMVGMITIFLSNQNGLINQLIESAGFEKIAFMNKPDLFDDIYVWSGVWQGMGWASIVYISTLSGIDSELYEAAKVDGINKLQKIWYIDIPFILPTATILLILNMGGIMSVGFEKVFLMQNSVNMPAAEVISTYVYKVGMQQADYSFSAAVGLFNSVINCILLVTVNFAAKKMGNTSLF